MESELLLITEVLPGACGKFISVYKADTVLYTTKRGSLYGVRKEPLYETFHPLSLGSVQLSLYNKRSKLEMLLPYLKEPSCTGKCALHQLVVVGLSEWSVSGEDKFDRRDNL